MGKKTYVTPMAVEEAFVANSYVAKCNNKVSESTGNQYRCINPYHSHSTINKTPGEIIGYVFVEATNTACTMIVTSSTVKTTLIDSNNGHPVQGATVYGPNGQAYTCNTAYTTGSGRNQTTWYIPSDSDNSSKCYGSFINEGTYSEWTENLFS